MARNEEKAQSLLNRWTSMKEDFADTFKNRRPFLVTDCVKLGDAEKWRRQVVKELTKKVADIQNAGLGEHVVRDLNDSINKLMREKRRWEKRIVELGGSDLGGGQPSYDGESTVLQTKGGYRYFGAAKNLPGVRELFEKDAPEPARRTREDLMKGITPDYYGYRDDDDGILVELESEIEKKRFDEAIDKWNQKHEIN